MDAYLPTTIGLFQPETKRGTFSTTIGSLNTVPLRMFLIVPLGLLHICLRPNSFTLASSGVIVAHLIPTPTFCRKADGKSRNLAPTYESYETTSGFAPGTAVPTAGFRHVRASCCMAKDKSSLKVCHYCAFFLQEQNYRA